MAQPASQCGPGIVRALVTLSPCHLVTLSLLLAGCDLPGQPKLADQPKPSNEVTDFKDLFRENCAGCHGADGKLGPAPPLNDPLFPRIIPKDTLRQVIQEGRPGTPMAAFAHAKGGTLTEEQIAALVAGIREHWSSSSSSTDQPPPYLGPEGKAEPSSANVEAGRKVFARACAGCHGEQGQGGMSAGAIHERTFLTLISNQALRRLIITGRPDLGMPNYAGTDGRSKDFQPLTSQEIGDLVALLASWRQGP